MSSVAVVGTGSAGQRHIANLVHLGCERVVAVSEHSRRDHLDIGGGEVEIVHDYAQALRSVGAVIVANATSSHLAYTRAAIEAGCHVLCEKPAATEARGVDELAQLAHDAGVVAAIGCQFRFNEALVGVRDLVASGALGTIVDVEATQGEHLADYHPDEDYRRSYAARADLGGGVLLTQIHQLDFLHWIFGPFDRVFASGGHRSTLEIDVEDTVTYLLQSENGLAVRGHLDYVQRPRRMDLTVTGTGGRVRWDYYRNEVELVGSERGDEPVVTRTEFERNAMFVALLRDFLAAVDGGPPPRSTFAEGAMVLGLVDAVKASLRAGRSVRIS